MASTHGVWQWESGVEPLCYYALRLQENPLFEYLLMTVFENLKVLWMLV